jgi:hypothetical protein
MATTIDISDITNNVQTTGVGQDTEVTGDGYFDDIMETVNKHLKAQFDAGRMTGDIYGRVYSQTMQSVLAQSMQFALAKRNAEIKSDIAEKELVIKGVESEIATGTKDNKIAMATQQLAKLTAEASYIDEQETQLINSVNYNNKIKALDSLADTYGTFGAGGLTVSSDMWNTYFSIVADLSTATAPTSTTVTKVT